MTAELQFTPEQEDKNIFWAHQSWLDAQEKNSGPLDAWHTSFRSIYEIQTMEAEHRKLSHIRELVGILAKLGISKEGRFAILNPIRDSKNYNYYPMIDKRTRFEISSWLKQHNKNLEDGFEAEITGLIFLLRYRDIGPQREVKDRQRVVLEQMANSSVELSELEPWRNSGQFKFRGAETIRKDWLKFRSNAIQRGFVDYRCIEALLTDSPYPERPLRFSDFPS